MKITQMMFSEGWGGAERFYVEFCSALSEAGHEVQAVCRSSFSKINMLMGIPGIRVEPVPARGNWDLLSLRLAERRIGSFSPGIIHSHLTRATWMAGRVGRKLGIPVVATTHNRIKPKYFRNIDYFSTITEDLGHYLASCGVPEERIRTIPNFSRFTPAGSPPAIVRDPPVFVSFGRFVPKKGYRHLIEAFSRISSEYKPARLLLGGSGPLDGTLRTLSSGLGLDGKVEFRGWVEDTRAFLDEGDIFVLPSLDEPFGIVILEAMARGKPIVSTATSGPCEILDESTAYMVRPGDSLDLYQALRKAIEDRAGRTLKARRALDLFKSKYTLEKTLPLFIDYYTDIVMRAAK